MRDDRRVSNCREEIKCGRIGQHHQDEMICIRQDHRIDFGKGLAALKPWPLGGYGVNTFEIAEGPNEKDSKCFFYLGGTDNRGVLRKHDAGTI